MPAAGFGCCAKCSCRRPGMADGVPGRPVPTAHNHAAIHSAEVPKDASHHRQRLDLTPAGLTQNDACQHFPDLIFGQVLEVAG
jgi:hypothetical protein